MTPAIPWLFAALAGTSPPTVEDSELPYAAWQKSAHPAPSALLLDRAPAPVSEEPEQARRLWEVVPEFGLALPSCRGRGPDCGEIRPGLEVALTLLYRPVPYFAFGATGRLDVFSIGRSDAVGGRDASATFFGLVGRLYPFESGIFDPYLELSLGGGALETTTNRSGQREATHVDFTPAARAAGGLDVALNPWLRLGPAFAISEYAAQTATYCAAEGCATRTGARLPLPRGATTLGFRLTIATGERL